MEKYSDKYDDELMELKQKYEISDELLNHFQSIINKKDSEIENFKKKFEDLNVIIDIIPNTISWVNKDLTYFGANSALAKTCGLTTEEFRGRPIGFHTKEKFFHEFVVELFESKQTTIYKELESKIHDIERSYLVSGTKIHDGNQAVVIGVDITELKSLKGHISFTEKLATLGEMFAGIIHDINNPLMMIDASAKRIKKKVHDEEITEILNKIELSSSKISKIIKGIKIFIRQDDTIPFQNEKWANIIDDAIIICENKLKEKNVKIEYDSQLKLLDLNCNFTQMFQVFVNLISNAVDAIENLDDKWIQITLDIEKNASESNAGFYTILFKDSGKGIPMDVQDKIFNAFYTTKGRGVGSGLGLSLCSKILEAHGGSISILNGVPNTTFILKLPRPSDK